jgi:hypothetical protein
MRQRRGFLHGWVLADVILGAIAGALLVIDLSILLASSFPTISTALAAMITGIATLALAGLTGVIIVFNAGVLAATRQAAEATQAEAEATKAEADATREAAIATREQVTELRISRQLEFRPFVVVSAMSEATRTVEQLAARDLTLRNVGRGPALNTFFVREERSGPGTRVLRSDPVNLSPGGSADVTAWEQDDPHPALFNRVDIPRELIFYQDQFANTHRLVPGFLDPAIWTREDDAGGLPAEPGWVRGVKEILFAIRPEPDPPPGPNFARAVSVTGQFGECQSTVALEAVPPSGVRPTDPMRDRTGRWMEMVKPGARLLTLDVLHWQLDVRGQLSGEKWEGRLEPGPTITIRQELDLNPRPEPPGGGQIEADLPLLSLVKWWREMLEGGIAALRDIGVTRFRPGLTLVSQGSWNRPRLVDVDFTGLPRPEARLVIPPHQIRNWSQVFISFEIGEFPTGVLEYAVRAILRIFGYQEVDKVIEALGINAKP